MTGEELEREFKEFRSRISPEEQMKNSRIRIGIEIISRLIRSFRAKERSKKIQDEMKRMRQAFVDQR